MKSSLFAFVACIFILVACGSDSSSNASSNGADTSADYDSILMGWLTVDEANHLITMDLDDDLDYTCVVDGDNYIWKQVSSHSEPASYKYEFRGDTLVLYSVYNYDGYVDRDGEMYIGGVAGNIYGSWVNCNRIYDSKDQVSRVFDDFSYMTEITDFSEGRFTRKIKYDKLDKFNDEKGDYMNSYFMLTLYQTLNGAFAVGIGSDLFYGSSSLQEYIQSQQINIKEQTKTSEVVEIKGKTYSINAEGTHYYPQTMGPFDGSLNRTGRVVVSDGEISCTLLYDDRFVDESMCNKEYKDHLRGQAEESNDNDGNEIQEVSNYYFSNTSEFCHCLSGMIAKQSN